jgi:hypothetical protein
MKEAASSTAHDENASSDLQSRYNADGYRKRARHPLTALKASMFIKETHSLLFGSFMSASPSP